MFRLVSSMTARSSYSLKIRSLAAVSQQSRNGRQSRSYHENVVDHFESPRHVGSMDKSSSNVGTGLVGAPACGDVMKLQIKVGVDGKIVETKFKTFGCGSAIASSSYVAEWLKGKTVDEATKIKNSNIAAHLKLPPVKIHCSMLAEDAVQAAIKDYQIKRNLTHGN